ncbi:MAG TPA: hypothetical protein VLH39_06290 [Magnetospirillaceae bacterium]|nr:hypothetical protein [Magnetospirillaceae bacterium]
MRRILARVRGVFGSLDSYSCLDQRDRQEFSYYQALYEDAILSIDERIARKALEPVDLRGFPQILSFPHYDIRAALFIGSFDPFQMTHLAAALRYLASAEASAPVVFVVAEGHDSLDKPRRSEYHYRQQLVRWQIEPVFQPLLYPLDIGEGADTIEIVRRFISRFPGASVRVTHLVGSDVLPYAIRMLPADMEAWETEARFQGVNFNYDLFVLQRGPDESWKASARDAEAAGVKVRWDGRNIGTPSSTDFRSNQAFSIVFPTRTVMRHVEVLFRYDLNKPWHPPAAP